MLPARIGLLLLCAVCLMPLSGCHSGSQPTGMSPQDKAAFEGGPMPESARKIIAERMREATAKSAHPAANNAGH